MRNLLAWNLATPEEAFAMASTLPRTLLAPALAAHAIPLPDSTVRFSPTLHPTEIRLGAETRRFSAPL